MTDWKKEKDVPFTDFLIKFLIFLYKLVGIKNTRIILSPVVFVYLLILPNKRKISRDFLMHVSKYNKNIKPNIFAIYKHFYSFALSMIEKVAVLNRDLRIKNIDKIDIADYNMIIEDVKKGNGFIAMCSHLGNTEFLHSITMQDDGSDIQKKAVNVLLSKEQSAKFKSILRNIKNDFDLNMIDSEDFGMDTMWLLSSKLENGEIVGMACDRTLTREEGGVREADFLGGKVCLPYGIFLLSALLNVPIYYVFILRRDDKFDSTRYIFFAHRSKVDLSDITRKNREEKINLLMKEYINLLEEKTINYPFQWYNFFNFWK